MMKNIVDVTKKINILLTDSVWFRRMKMQVTHFFQQPTKVVRKGVHFWVMLVIDDERRNVRAHERPEVGRRCVNVAHIRMQSYHTVIVEKLFTKMKP